LGKVVRGGVFGSDQEVGDVVSIHIARGAEGRSDPIVSLRAKHFVAICSGCESRQVYAAQTVAAEDDINYSARQSNNSRHVEACLGSRNQHVIVAVVVYISSHCNQFSRGIACN
jgi:hypothetical protein